MIGDRKEEFSYKKINEYLEDPADDFKKAKDYLTSYLIKSLSNFGYIYFNPTNHTVEYLDKRKLFSLFDNIKPATTIINGKPLMIFNLKKWFLYEYHECAYINQSMNEKLIYYKDGTRYINALPELLIARNKKFKSYPSKIKKDVQFLLNHLKYVFNSGNNSCYNYSLNWLACCLNGRKMHTAMVLVSGEGVGKSLFFDVFIGKKILGKLYEQSTDPHQLFTYSKSLVGKVLILLEELPTQSKSDWFSLSDRLKNVITNDTLKVRPLYQEPYTINNLTNWIIVSNNDNILKFGSDMRRYHLLDVSHKKVNDTKYWDEMARICNSYLVAEAFFCYLNEHYHNIKDSFNEFIIPLSQSKLAMKEKNMSDINKFIYEKYLMTNSDIEQQRLRTFYEYYNEWTHLTVGIKQFKKDLERYLPIAKIKIASKERCNCIMKLTHAEILKFYKDRGYWSQEDDELLRDYINDNENKKQIYNDEENDSDYNDNDNDEKQQTEQQTIKKTNSTKYLTNKKCVLDLLF